MKKRIIAFFSVLMIFCAAVPVNAASLCPINYSCFITHDDEGVPSIHFRFVNTSEKKIVRADYRGSLLDRSFAPANDRTGKTSSFYIRITNLSVEGNAAEQSETVTSLSTYPSAAHVEKVTYLKIVFDDGTSWEGSASPEAHAKLLCRDAIKDGRYASEDGTLHFADASSGSQMREWFYWDDGSMEWKLFSYDLCPLFKTSLAENCIKLQINGDPMNYDIMSVSASVPRIAATLYNSGETLYSDSGIMSFKPAELGAPYKIALWDFNEGKTSRKWFLWSDEQGGWQFVSSEQGPMLDMISKAPICLKVEYEGNHQDYLVYNIYMQ